MNCNLTGIVFSNVSVESLNINLFPSKCENHPVGLATGSFRSIISMFISYSLPISHLVSLTKDPSLLLLDRQATIIRKEAGKICLNNIPIYNSVCVHME